MVIEYLSLFGRASLYIFLLALIRAETVDIFTAIVKSDAKTFVDASVFLFSIFVVTFAVKIVSTVFVRVTMVVRGDVDTMAP